MIYRQLRKAYLVNKLLAPVFARTGWCLWFAQEIFRVPHIYPSAWLAWKATKYRHTTRTMPNVDVPVWFSHYGTYGTPPTYGNWGHVVVWKADKKKFVSSPISGYGRSWLNSIEEIERTFNCEFVGWSEDISGVRVVEPVKEDEMYKGKTAKQWYDAYMKAKAERNSFLTKLVGIRKYFTK